MEVPMKLWLYRTLETDDDGDPLDHGVVKATTTKLALRLVKERLQTIVPGTDVVVRMYGMKDRINAGVLDDNGDRGDFRMRVPEADGRCCERDTNADGNCDRHPGHPAMQRQQA